MGGLLSHSLAKEIVLTWLTWMSVGLLEFGNREKVALWLASFDHPDSIGVLLLSTQTARWLWLIGSMIALMVVTPPIFAFLYFPILLKTRRSILRFPHISVSKITLALVAIFSLSMTLNHFSISEDNTTDTEERAIAKPAHIGSSCTPALPCYKWPSIVTDSMT